MRLQTRLHFRIKFFPLNFGKNGNFSKRFGILTEIGNIFKLYEIFLCFYGFLKSIRFETFPGYRVFGTFIPTFGIFILKFRDFISKFQDFYSKFRDFYSQVSRFLFPSFGTLFLSFGIFIPKFRDFFSIGIYIPGIRIFRYFEIFISRQKVISILKVKIYWGLRTKTIIIIA